MDSIDMNNLEIIAPLLLENSERNEAEVLGSTIWLWTHSEEHKEIPIELLPILLFPAISHQQYVLILQNNQPIFFIAWAGLSEEAEQRYLKNPAVLMPASDWNSGDRLWFTDWVAPFGHNFPIVRMLRRTLFKQHCGRSLYHRGTERGMRIMTFRGAEVTQQQFDQWNQTHAVNLG